MSSANGNIYLNTVVKEKDPNTYYVDHSTQQTKIH